MKQFSPKLKALREKAGLNQSQLADKLCVSRGSISFYENGDRIPDIEFLCKVSEYFDVSADWLLGLSDVKSLDVDIKGISEKTGLSEKAATKLKQLNSDSVGNIAKGYTVTSNSILDDLICSDLFLLFLGELGFYFIYGGGLPSEAYTREAQELSIAEINRFYEWANNQGLAVIARKDVSEMYLQKACDILKKIAKQCLEEQVESLRKNTDTH